MNLLEEAERSAIFETLSIQQRGYIGYLFAIFKTAFILSSFLPDIIADFLKKIDALIQIFQSLLFSCKAC